MELQRGICNLCAENGRVLKPPDAGNILGMIPKAINELFTSDSEVNVV